MENHVEMKNFVRFIFNENTVSSMFDVSNFNYFKFLNMVYKALPMDIIAHIQETYMSILVPELAQIQRLIYGPDNMKRKQVIRRWSKINIISIGGAFESYYLCLNNIHITEERGMLRQFSHNKIYSMEYCQIDFSLIILGLDFNFDYVEEMLDNKCRENSKL